jgi:hypothetical protein
LVGNVEQLFGQVGVEGKIGQHFFIAAQGPGGLENGRDRYPGNPVVILEGVQQPFGVFVEFGSGGVGGLVIGDGVVIGQRMVNHVGVAACAEFGLVIDRAPADAPFVYVFAGFVIVRIGPADGGQQQVGAQGAVEAVGVAAARMLQGFLGEFGVPLSGVREIRA